MGREVMMEIVRGDHAVTEMFLAAQVGLEGLGTCSQFDGMLLRP